LHNTKYDNSICGSLVCNIDSLFKGDTNNAEEIDTEPKSKESQAFKLFSEGKTPVEVVVALDLPADQVQAIYREFWELKGM
jgi:hypothetical protein